MSKRVLTIQCFYTVKFLFWWAYFRGGGYYWREFRALKFVRLIFEGDFAAENDKAQMGILCYAVK